MIAALTVAAGLSLVADEPTPTEQFRTQMQQMVTRVLGGIATNQTFDAWKAVNQANRDFNEKVLNNANFDKTISSLFNEKVKETITHLTPISESEVDRQLFEFGFRYRATVDLSDFGYAFTENEDGTGFDVAESGDGSFSMTYWAKKASDTQQQENPPPGAPEQENPPPGTPEPKDVYQRLTLTADGDAYETLIPVADGRLAIIVRYPQTYQFLVENQNGQEWQQVMAGSVTNDLEQTDPSLPYVKIIDDAWNVTGWLAVSAPAQGGQGQTVSRAEFALGQDPQQNRAGAQLAFFRDDTPVVSTRLVTTNGSETTTTIDLSSRTAILDLIQGTLSTLGVEEFSISLRDMAKFNMTVSDCGRVNRIQRDMAAARRNGAGEDVMNGYIAELDPLVDASATFVTNAVTMSEVTFPLSFRTVKAGADWWVVPAFHVDPNAGDEGWVLITELFTQEGSLYMINIVDHAVEPAKDAAKTIMQLASYLTSLVRQRVNADNVIPASFAERISDTIRERMREAASNVDITSWNVFNDLFSKFNTYVLNNPNFERAILAKFNEKVADSITPAEGELFDMGYRFVASVDLSNFNYTFTVNADRTGFDVTENDTGFEIIVPGRDVVTGELIEQAMKFSLTASGATSRLIGPSLTNRKLAIILTVPEKFNFSIADKFTGEWVARTTGEIENAYEKLDESSEFVNLVTDGWNVAVSVNTDLPAVQNQSADATSLYFAIGQHPATDTAGVRMAYERNGRQLFDIETVVATTGEAIDFSSLADTSPTDLIGIVAQMRSGTTVKARLMDTLDVEMSSADPATLLGLVQQLADARRSNAGFDAVDAVVQQLNEKIAMSAKLTRGEDHTLAFPMKLITVPFGVTYTATLGVKFPDNEDYVAVASLFDKETQAYAMNVLDQCIPELQDSAAVVKQLATFVRSVVEEYREADRLIPSSIAAAISADIKERFRAAASNVNISSWTFLNFLFGEINTNILNNPNFEKAVLATFNERVFESIVEAEDEIADMGFKYVATVDFSDFNYTFTARPDASGFDVTENNTGLEIVLPSNDNAANKPTLMFSVTSSGSTSSILVPSRTSSGLALILTVPEKFNFSIAGKTSGDWDARVRGEVHNAYIKQNESALFVNPLTDGWNVSATIETDFPAIGDRPADSTSLYFAIGQEPVSDTAGVKFTYVHNGREAIDVETEITTTGAAIDFSSLTPTSSIADLIGLVAQTRSGTTTKVRLMGAVAIEMSAANSPAFLALSQQLAEARRTNAGFDAIDAIVQRINENVTVKAQFTRGGRVLPEAPLKFITVPFGISYTASLAIQFPDSEEFYPFSSFFDSETQGYALNILDQVTPEVMNSVGVARQLAAFTTSIAREYAAATENTDIESIIFGAWTEKAAKILGGAVYDAEGDVAGVLQFKFGKPNAKKGTVKLSGRVTLLNGKRYNIKSTNVTLPADGPLAVENVTVTTLGSLSATIGDAGFTGEIGDAYTFASATVGGNWTAADSGVFVGFGEEGAARLPDGTDVALLPNGEPVLPKNGGKWGFNKAAKITLSADKASLVAVTDGGKTNFSALKLSYQPKTGFFKGSFKIYAIQNGRLKKLTVKVSGVVADGTGYGIATLPSSGATWAVTVDTLD